MGIDFTVDSPMDDLLTANKSSTFQNLKQVEYKSSVIGDLRRIELKSSIHLCDFVGQDKIVNALKVYIEAARFRHEPLDHVLVYGAWGLGKSTLSSIIANEMGAHIYMTPASDFKTPGDMVAHLTNLGENDIVLIDEIQNLDRSIVEILLPAMEDFAIDILIGKGCDTNSIRMDLPRFTLIGETTRIKSLSEPLRNQFGIQCKLEPYAPEALATIMMRTASGLGIRIEEAAALELAEHAHGFPKNADRMLRRARDFAQIMADGVITSEVADLTIQAMGL